MELMARNQVNHNRERILVVEDNLTCSTIAASLLLSNGCFVDIATNYVEAIEAVEQSNYSLLVLDWQLPFKSGGDVLVTLDKIVDKKRVVIPFVIYTSTDPQKIFLPHTFNFRLIDFWLKGNSKKNWKSRVPSIVNRIKGAKSESFR